VKRTASRIFEIGTHVCGLYSSRSELATLVATFLADGLRHRERCCYVAAGDEGDAIWNELRHAGVDIVRESERGALEILDGGQIYIAQDAFDPRRTLGLFKEAVEHALEDEFTGFRVAADMTWALSVPQGAQAVIAYEALVRQLFLTSRATALCLYGRQHMPLAVVNGALATHPVTFLRRAASVNPFYDPDVMALPVCDDHAILTKLDTLDGLHALPDTGRTSSR
jgi:hypothetical protein